MDKLGPAVVEDVDEVVRRLAQEGLIDPERVGLVGFSFGACMVDFALTNYRNSRFAAAVSAEGFTASYGYYLIYSILNEDSGGLTEELNRYYAGDGSFWHNKASWLSTAPGFNLEKVTAPVLLMSSGEDVYGGGMEMDLEFVSGLTINAHPFEYLYFPRGSHPLRRPQERLASQEATVDWMRFWLLGEEDPAAAKLSQYRRWRILRAQRDKAIPNR